MKTKSISDYSNVYFVGIGGIGMSALARYFKSLGKNVIGYDKTETPLTIALETEGIAVHYHDLGDNLPIEFKNTETTLVVFTPAIPKNHGEINYFIEHNFQVLKRAEVLGLITRSSLGIGVAGTHGKTTTSTLLAHILSTSTVGCNAFLGGISSNTNSNLILHPSSPYTVIEADEFDRSFLQLSPKIAIITSTDADHLDIYGDEKVFLEGFQSYANLIKSDGYSVIKEGLNLTSPSNVVHYAVNTPSDFWADELSYANGKFYFTLHTRTEIWKNVELGIPGIHNVENAVACIAVALYIGLTESEIRHGLSSFKGVKRRFEYQVRTEDIVYIDDYAHHPTEINALMSSVKLMYPDKDILTVFQPHLFTRTRDFMQAFANALSATDELVLLPIYPARELPIAGITSESLLQLCNAQKQQVIDADKVVDYISKRKNQVILTVGAGDIDRIINPLRNVIS
jgi:UDP-N-acetylmuramate--alanine ligase